MNDKVYTIDEWYDGARFGIADFESKPHFYRSIYLDYSEWNAEEDRFELSETSNEVKEKAIELARIFERWDEYRKSNPDREYSEEEFGALPEEMYRYRELKSYIKSQFEEAKKSSLFIKRGKFNYGNNTIVTWLD